MNKLEQLLKRPVAELSERFLERSAPVPRGLLEALEADPRRAARALARRLRARAGDNRAEGQRLRHLLRFETELWAEGRVHVAGVDEAGMAPLAGPVVAAAAVLPRGFKLRGLDDSKKIADPERREELAAAIKGAAVTWAVGLAEVEEIDRLNIYHAGLLAMRRAVEGLALVPDFVLVDARRIPECPAPQRGIVHGDELSLSIAAASVLAKTTRDRMMAELDARYPGYGLATHKGYPTPAHVRAMKALGVLPIHRRSFAPVREALGLLPLQQELPGMGAPPATDAGSTAANTGHGVGPAATGSPDLPPPPDACLTLEGVHTVTTVHLDEADAPPAGPAQAEG